MSNQAKKKRISSSGTLFAYFGHQRKRKKKRNKSVTSCTKREMTADNTQNPEDQMNDKGLYFSALVFREETNHTKDLLS